MKIKTRENKIRILAETVFSNSAVASENLLSS